MDLGGLKGFKNLQSTRRLLKLGYHRSSWSEQDLRLMASPKSFLDACLLNILPIDIVTLNTALRQPSS